MCARIDRGTKSGNADRRSARCRAERVYSDTATGANANRHGLEDLLSRVRAGDTVVVWRLDRLARSLKDLIDLAANFDAAGVHLQSLTEGIYDEIEAEAFAQNYLEGAIDGGIIETQPMNIENKPPEIIEALRTEAVEPIE